MFQHRDEGFFNRFETRIGKTHRKDSCATPQPRYNGRTRDRYQNAQPRPMCHENFVHESKSVGKLGIGYKIRRHVWHQPRKAVFGTAPKCRAHSDSQQPQEGLSLNPQSNDHSLSTYSKPGAGGLIGGAQIPRRRPRTKPSSNGIPGPRGVRVTKVLAL